MQVTPQEVLQNLAEIEQQICEACAKSGRPRQAVHLVAVTKTVDPLLVNTVLEAGVSIIGENRLQEFLQKQPQYTPGYELQFIGHLQTNKAAKAVAWADVIASVDSVRLMEAIEKEAARQQKVQKICLEWNVADEQDKTGADLETVLALANLAKDCPHLKVVGLMCIPPFNPNKEASRPYFVQMRQLFCNLNSAAYPHLQLEILSMGMSGDFDVAIEEGATHVRVGSRLFGPRPKKA